MNQATRRHLAYIAGTIARGTPPASLCNREATVFYRYNWQLDSQNRFTCYAFDRRCYIAGFFDDERVVLKDYGTHQEFRCEWQDGKNGFQGTCGDSRPLFNGKISNDSIQIVDLSHQPIETIFYFS